LGIGATFITSHIEKADEYNEYYEDKKIDSGFTPYGGLKVGYAF